MNERSSPQWVVMKFGGTSVSSLACWDTICAQAVKHRNEGKDVLIVVSALSGMTNLLTSLAGEVDEGERERIRCEIIERHRDMFTRLEIEPSERFQAHHRKLLEIIDGAGERMGDRQRAELLAHGELLSSSMGEQVLGAAGLEASWQDARQLLRALPETESEPLSVRCEDQADPELAKRLATIGGLHITQGFIASDSEGRTCLLGRGGSDTSAACFAALLSAVSLEIWTDVPGMFSADPRKVPEARLLRQLSYMEAQELASMGAKVLHPPSIQPARQNDIPVSIKDTNHPGEAGTRIAKRVQGQGGQVKGVVSREDITVITMSNPAMWRQAGFLADAFSVFRDHGYSVDLVSTSESTVTVSLDPQVPAHHDGQRMAAFLADLERLCRVRVYRGCVSISLVGNAIRTILGRLSAALDVFQDHHVYMVTQSANDLNLTLVVDSANAGNLVRELHAELIPPVKADCPQFGASWTDLVQPTGKS
jgi:diaminopimelate decarboxylase/aspartate kinase